MLVSMIGLLTADPMLWILLRNKLFLCSDFHSLGIAAAEVEGYQLTLIAWKNDD